ncbi:MAG: hypothetical protein GYB41_17060 [Oceanospirillales bacterium]|nr:hypothetical protein [Oceanospirillales bacterium]
MTNIIQRQADEQELKYSRQWQRWESGETTRFEYHYEQDVEFIVQSGEAIIRTQFNDQLHILPGSHITIGKGVEGKWEILSPICNRYRYLG